MQKLLRWLRHVKRMDCGRFLKTAIFREPHDGTKEQGHPPLRNHNDCKSDMKSFDTNVPGEPEKSSHF